jgi:transposase
MPRLIFDDASWAKLQALLLSNGVYDTDNLRMSVEGIAYKIRTGAPWRDLPPEFGNWNAVFKMFNRFCKKNIFASVFRDVSVNSYDETHYIDATIVKAHQHSSGARLGEQTAIGRCVAGNSSKIHLAVEASGLPIAYEITEGQVHDSKMASAILEKLEHVEMIVCDKGYDSESFREEIRKRDAEHCIPRKKNSVIGNDDVDFGVYKFRHLVENMFARMKHFRSLATRYEKLKRNYNGVVAFICSIIWLKHC